MSVQEAAFTSIETLINADTGSGGLKNSASDAFVYGVFRQGDQRRTIPWPNIFVQIDEDDESPMGDTVDSVSRLRIRFTIEADRDAANSFTKQNAVDARLRSKMRRVVLASQTINTKTYAFSPAERLGSSQQVPGGKTNNLSCMYATTVRGT